MYQTLKDILERRSCRKFTDRVPAYDKIGQIVQAGVYAPSGMNRQSVKLIVFNDKKERDRLAEENRKIGGWDEGFDPFYGAPVIIVALYDKSVRTGIYDASLAMENMLLAAQALDLGAIWIHRAKEEFETDYYRDMLKKFGIEGEYEAVGHVAVGYRDGDNPPAPERKQGRVFYINEPDF